MAQENTPHKRRFTRWCRLGGEPLITLALLVEERVVSAMTQDGFARAERWWTDPERPVGAGEIVLIREVGEDIEEIIVNFDKYHRPAFQLHLDRRKSAAPYEWVRAANLVARPTQYLYFWGKPWWLPRRFWSKSMSERTVTCIVDRLAEAKAFLDYGRRGRCISRPIDN